MRLLLDTHTFLWFIAGNPNLSHRARKLIEDVANEKWVSTASLWEIAIKVSISKLVLSAPFHVLIPQQIDSNGFEILDVKMAHTIAVTTLPQHHSDPFDRLIIAQAMVEQMTVISVDKTFDAYPVTRLW